MKYLLIALFSLFFVFNTSYSQELHSSYGGTFRGKVLEVLKDEKIEVPGIENLQTLQLIKVEVLDGILKGKVIEFENDYIELKKGDRFYFNYIKEVTGEERYAVTNIDRKISLFILALIFIISVVVFGGWQGVRSILSLLGSFLVIFYILIPGLLNGWNPITASFFVATGILFVAIFFTHGFNKESLVAFSGTIIAVLITTIFALFSVEYSGLTGFSDDVSTYLNFGTRGLLNFRSLLLGAIIIGFLGVLDDIAITQSAIVSELYQSNENISKKEVFNRAMRIGKEHVGALVNTLILAYTGASLPILLYFNLGEMKFGSVVSMEIFATEIVRAIVGSIGLILTVPIVTILAVFYLKGYKSKSHHNHYH